MFMATHMSSGISCFEYQLKYLLLCSWNPILGNNLCGFLSIQAAYLEAEELLSLAKLADHLGLSSLLNTAADRLIKLPWHKHMSLLAARFKLAVYTTDTDKRVTLLHHSQRGACTELQVLAVLEHMGIPRANCASFLDLKGLQTAVLQGLLALLVDSAEDPGPLLRIAARLELIPEALRIPPDWSKSTRIVHNIMLLAPDSGVSAQHIALPECQLELHLRFLREEGRAVNLALAVCHGNGSVCTVSKRHQDVIQFPH